ncbi:MAG: NapH/MauN family ferredoxin-type protein, partial [bacterium]|nr:NapH/MauN family ferredoxin-type protein [bacterium]
MNYIRESLSQVIGNKPRRASKAEQPQVLQDIYQAKRGTLTKAKLEAVRHEHRKTCCNKWQMRRWITIILVNLLFAVSYYWDIQLLEGAMT